MNCMKTILVAGMCAATAMATEPLDIQSRQEEFGVADIDKSGGGQAQIDLEVVEKMKEAVMALGASAAKAAMFAGSAAEADHVLAAFSRAMRRCNDLGNIPLDPGGGSIEPVLRAVDIAEIADRQRAIWEAEPEDKERWNGGVSEAAGRFHGVPFRLRDGGATIKAPCGLFNEPNRDYTKDLDGNEVPWRQWCLETLPQWTFSFAGKDCFLLVAQGLDDNGHSRYGDAAREDALLLFWRDKDDAAAGGAWDCSYLASRLYPLEINGTVALEECKDPDFGGTLLKVDTFWRSKAAGDLPAVFGLSIDKDSGRMGTCLWEQTVSRLFDGWPIRAIWSADALQGSQYSNDWAKAENIDCWVSLMNPQPDDALDKFLESGLRDGARRGCAISTDDFDPFVNPANNADKLADAEAIRALLSLYEERKGFERSLNEETVDGWRKSEKPCLLVVCMVNQIGGDHEESIDFAISLDGGYLVFENGYMMPCATMPDGSIHQRIADGGALLAIPDERREEVMSLLRKIVAKMPTALRESHKQEMGQNEINCVDNDSGADLSSGGNIDDTQEAAGVEGDLRAAVPAMESPFATSLTAEETAGAVGKDTEAENLFPADLPFDFGMARWRVRLFHWSFIRDGESGRDILFSNGWLKKLGGGTVELEFTEGRLASIYNFWSYDTGCTAKNPGAVRERLDYALRHLGPPTHRWTQVTQDVLDDGTVMACAWHVWHWTKGNQDAVFEIRRMDDAMESLRASFMAGAIHDREDYFKWLGAPDSLFPEKVCEGAQTP